MTLMTIHASKGLEFSNVFITGLEEELFPAQQCVTTPAALEEERRLFYVGMTRAKKELMLCYVRRQYEKERDPSRFLEETGL